MASVGCLYLFSWDGIGFLLIVKHFFLASRVYFAAFASYLCSFLHISQEQETIYLNFCNVLSVPLWFFVLHVFKVCSTFFCVCPHPPLPPTLYFYSFMVIFIADQVRGWEGDKINLILRLYILPLAK